MASKAVGARVTGEGTAPPSENDRLAWSLGSTIFLARLTVSILMVTSLYFALLSAAAARTTALPTELAPVLRRPLRASILTPAGAETRLQVTACLASAGRTSAVRETDLPAMSFPGTLGILTLVGAA